MEKLIVAHTPCGNKLGAYLVPMYANLVEAESGFYQYPAGQVLAPVKVGVSPNGLYLKDGREVPAVVNIVQKLDNLSLSNERQARWNESIEKGEWSLRKEVKVFQKCDRAENPGIEREPIAYWLHPEFPSQESKPAPYAPEQFYDLATERARLEAHNERALALQKQYMAECFQR